LVGPGGGLEERLAGQEVELFELDRFLQLKRGEVVAEDLDEAAAPVDGEVEQGGEGAVVGAQGGPGHVGGRDGAFGHGRAVDRGRLGVVAGRGEAGEPVEGLRVAGEGDAEGEQRRGGAGVAVSYEGGEQLAVAVDGGGGGHGRDGPAGPAAGSRRTHSSSRALRALPWACRARPRAMAASGSRSSRWRATVA